MSITLDVVHLPLSSGCLVCKQEAASRPAIFNVYHSRLGNIVWRESGQFLHKKIHFRVMSRVYSTLFSISFCDSSERFHDTKPCVQNALARPFEKVEVGQWGGWPASLTSASETPSRVRMKTMTTKRGWGWDVGHNENMKHSSMTFSSLGCGNGRLVSHEIWGCCPLLAWSIGANRWDSTVEGYRPETCGTD